jgi:NAD(P)-dependent dehydrogenase (short-subunit alcohol dehydrogenase family)
MTDGAVVVVGGTSGLGKEVARHYVQADREVVITGRDPTRGSSVAAELGGKTTELAFDLSRPKEIAPALEGWRREPACPGRGPSRRNTMREYDVGGHRPGDLSSSVHRGRARVDRLTTTRRS